MDENKIVSFKYIPILINKYLYDGFERGFFDKKFQIEVDGEQSVTITSLEFSSYKGKDFKNLEGAIDSKSFNTIIKEGGFKKRTPASLGYFCKEEHISIEYFIKGNYLLAFTYGEKQPSRWILVLEGIWKIEF